MATETLEIVDQIKETARHNGKLLVIQEISNWLLTQPETLSKEGIIVYLMDVAGEVINE